MRGELQPEDLQILGAIVDGTGEEGATSPFALFNARAIAAAALSRTGAVLAATQAFAEAGHERLIDADIVARAGAGGPDTLKVVTALPDATTTGLVAYASARAAAAWRLPPRIAEALREDGGRVLVLTTILSNFEPLREACRAYGLSGLQTRIALATIRHGSIKSAAESLEVSYQTAREGLAEAMKRTGVERLPGLVTRLTTLAFGVLPGRPTSADVLADIWGMTERQIAIAGIVANGMSRTQAAQALELSPAVVKKELDCVYSLLQVTSAAGLARKLAEARAFGWMTQATGGDVGFLDDAAEPLRFALRPDKSRIAYSDYGPPSGRPVLVVHSSMTTRIVSRKLLRALHAAGYRPIAIDRPGFGLTDPLAQPGAAARPFRAATADVATVLSDMRIRSVDIVARGAAQFVIELSRAMPDRLDRVVLINPGPPYGLSGRGNGVFQRLKVAFLRNPASIRRMARLLARQLTLARVSQLLVRWTRGSAADERAIQDPEIVADFYRSVRMFAADHYAGFINEQAAIARGSYPQALNGGRGWLVLLGEHDMLNEPEVALSYWRAQLPHADFRVVEGAGRFLAMTRPDLVVRGLGETAPPTGRSAPR